MRSDDIFTKDRALHDQQQGFTLIELSIVLVIVGLLVGGIIVAKSIIRFTQLLTVTSQEVRYARAVSDFWQKLGALPGDMTDATKFWGAAGGTTGDNYTTSCYGAQGGGTQTCNGNGNGQIGRLDNSSEWDEDFRVWQHLSNAGMIEPSSFTGITDSQLHHIIGTNCPASKVKGAGFGLFYVPISSLPSSWFPNIAQAHAIFFGGNGIDSEPFGAVLTPGESLSIDQKSDDGLPGSGNILTQNSTFNGGQCATSTDPTTAKYNTSTTATTCQLQFKQDF